MKWKPRKWVTGVQCGDKEHKFEKPVTLLEALYKLREL